MPHPGFTIHELSCIKDGKWEPERPEDYSDACKIGASCADEVIRAVAATENPALFASVIRLMMESGRYGPAEIGFCNRVGIHLINVPVNGRP